MKKLTPRQHLFVHEYLVDLNATRAASRAGYSRKTAPEQGARLLKNVKVAAVISRAQKKREKRLEITADEWVRELWIVGRSDLKNYITIDKDTGAIKAKGFEDMPEGTSRALEAIEENRTIRESADGKESNVVNDKVKFKMHCKIPALELIGKHLGFFKDPKLELSGNLNLNAKLSLADFKKSMKEVSGD